MVTDALLILLAISAVAVPGYLAGSRGRRVHSAAVVFGGLGFFLVYQFILMIRIQSNHIWNDAGAGDLMLAFIIIPSSLIGALVARKRPLLRVLFFHGSLVAGSIVALMGTNLLLSLIVRSHH